MVLAGKETTEISLKFTAAQEFGLLLLICVLKGAQDLSLTWTENCQLLIRLFKMEQFMDKSTCTHKLFKRSSCFGFVSPI